LTKFSGIISVYTFGIIASSPLEIVWTARGQTVYAAIVILISELTKAAAWTIPVICGWGLEGTVLGMAGYSMARLLVTWGIHFRIAKKIWQPEIWLAQLRYALPLGAAVALMVPQQALHQYLISAQLGAALFAAYSVAIFQMPIFDLFYGPMSEILMVRVAELDKEGRSAEAAKAFLNTVQKLAFFFIPIVVLLVLLAPNIIEALFTKKYLSSTPVFRVAACAGLLACIPVEGALRAKGQTRSLFLGSIIKLVLTVPLAIWGIRRWELMGGIVAWLLAEAIAKLFWVQRLQKVMGIGKNMVVSWGKKEFPALALATLGATIGTLGIQKYLSEFDGLVWVCTLSACFKILYLGAFWLVQSRMQSASDT
jgi:O-antigen/teichoic acid export membrane protein